MEKMTNKKALEFVLGLEVVVANEEVYAKLQKMLEQNEKKNSSGKGTLSKEQKENVLIKDLIVSVLEEVAEPKQIKELQSIDKLAKYSNQKLSALLRQLVSEGRVTRTEEKKIAKFSIA